VEQWEALRHGRVQVGFLYDPPPWAHLRSEPLWRQEILLAVPAAHPLAKGSGPVPLALAVREPFLWFDRACAPMPHDLVRRLFESRGLTMRVVEEAASEEARLSLVAGGLGVTLVPGSADAPARPGIALRRVQEIDFGVQVYAAHEGRTSQEALAFLDEMRVVLEESSQMPRRSRTGT
jgi:DNA-binding transcriptional LysR family regulator